MVKELVSYCNKNKGMKLTDLKIFLKQNNLDFDINYITKEFWWFDDGKDKENEYEGDNFPLRLQLFILWVCFRKENNILIISHSHVHSQIQGKGIYNADFKELNKEYLFNYCKGLFENYFYFYIILIYFLALIGIEKFLYFIFYYNHLRIHHLYFLLIIFFSFLIKIEY